jgi:hypothetical protein
MNEPKPAPLPSELAKNLRAKAIAEKNRQRAVIGPPENRCAGCKAPCGESVLCGECANAGRVELTPDAPRKISPQESRDRLLAITAAYHAANARKIPADRLSSHVMNFAKVFVAAESGTRRSMCLEV